MKKALFILMTVMAPLFLLAQPMDTLTIYFENFDGDSVTLNSPGTPQHGAPIGDWRVVGTGITYPDWTPTYELYKSSPNSYRTPVYAASGNSQATTAPIPLTTTSFPVNKIYFNFDHICKIHNLDPATIYYQVAQGFDADGNYNWGQWKQVNFTSNNSGPLYYYGDAMGSTTITGGAFSHNAYSNWVSNSITVQPNNTWWHHEMLDLTYFIFVGSGAANPTHFRLQFRVNKASPPTSGTEACAGWFIDNMAFKLSNCELIPPRILMQSPFYYNTNNSFVNQLGPFTIKCKLTDNDTVNLNSVVFSYEINSGPTVIVPNTNAFSGNIRTTANSYSGHDTIHSIDAQWELPAVCYADTIYYHIYMEDVHGSKTRFDTFLVAHHNYTNIHQNDVRLDSLSTMPHCLITGQPQPISVFFTNRADAAHSPSNNEMISGSFTLEVRNEAGTVTHTSSHNWTGDICFDIPSSQALGTFTPTHGYNYVTVYVTTRNGQVDGYHQNDTIRISPYACDSLLQGHYTVGGTNPDFPDLAAVKVALDYCGLGGPAVFHLRPGTYSGFDFTENYIGQSSVNTVTFQGDDANSVILVNNNVDAGANIFGAVTLVNVKDFVFRNLTIQGNDTTVSRGVVVRGAGSRNILFDNCIIKARNTHTNDFNSCAVVRSTASPTAVLDTITFRNCTIPSGNVGIYYVGGNNKRNQLVVDNCDITACYRGICLNYTNGVVSNNHIKQVASSNPQNFSGIHASYPTGLDITDNTIDSVITMEYAVYLTNATLQDFFIRNNKIHVGNGTSVIYVNNSQATHTTGSNPVNMDGYIANNEVIFYPVTANNSYAIQVNNSKDIYVVNNSVLVKSDAPYSNTAALYSSTGNNGIYIYNNILMNKTVCSDNTDYPLYFNAGSTATGTFNDFYSGSGVVAYKTVARSSIAELQNAITTLTDNISVMPTIANELESLLPDPMSGLECWRHTSVTKDIRGINRSDLTYMGAYADVIPNYDAELTSIVSPALGECPQSSYDITVKITNKGGYPLNFASTPATILLQSTSLNLNQTITVNTGTIATLNSMDKVLTSGVVIPSNQPVDFTIIINYPGDSQHANDTLRQNFTLEYIIPDYEEDFSNGPSQTWTIEQISGAGNWTFQNGEGTNPTIMPVYGIGRLFFNSKTFAANTTSRAILPVTVLDNATNPILEIWFAQDNAVSSKKDTMTVKISTNNGLTYTNLIPQGQTTAPLHRYLQSATTPKWTRFVYNLSNYVNNGCVYIAFDATSRGGNNINIDRIRVRSLYPNDIAVSKIYGSGETPTQYAMRDVVSALVRNDGSQTQSNIQVYLNVVGAAEQWHDTITIASLAPNTETVVTFPDHLYNVAEVKDVEVRCANDQNNNNNSQHWRMVTTMESAVIADTTTDIQLLGDYNNIIRPCVRYKTNEDLAVRAVKYYYDQTYIADPENGFRAFVADANGTILATSQVIDFSTLQQHAWNEIPIYNFALTNTTGEFYVGLEMLSHGNYLCSQVETPLRDSTFFYLNNGVYEPQLTGRFMIGAVVDTPFVNDMAILELVNPVTDCDLGHEHLQVRITNNGTTDIVPPVQMHYTVNGGATVSEALTDTLHSHETTVFTFNSIYDFTNNQINVDDNYTIRVWSTKLPQDRLTYNDTLGLTVVSKGKAVMPTAQDTVIVNYHTSTTLSAQLPAAISEGVLGWYKNTGYESWELLTYNPTYTTPLIYFDTTYYVTANPGTLDVVTVGTGTSDGTDPFAFTNGYSKGRMLYLEQEIGAHGTLTSFALQVKTPVSAAASAGIPMKIYMKCTDENVFTSTAVNWDDEILGATLVVDDRVYFNQAGWYEFNLIAPFEYSNGNLEVFVETNCADYCTGTGSQCNNCGQYVSGANSYPKFFVSNTSATLCQKKAGNNASAMTGAWTNVSKRINARFTVANLECGSQKVPVHIHVPDIPSYDVETQELLYPQTSCALYNEHIQVQLKNMLNIAIPANKVVVHAIFNGSEVTHVVDEAFAPEEVKVVEFTTPFDFSAPTANITFNYTIYTTLNGETVVYGGNDTITGQFQSTRTAYLPDSIVYTGGYTLPYTILEPADRSTSITQYYFYDAFDAANPIHTTTTAAPFMTTDPLYDTVVFWVSGKTQQSNCITKRIPVIINVFRPQYDLSTEELIYPVSYQCATSLNPQLQVSVMNQDTTSGTSIPAGTFNLNANFTGAATVNGTNLINTPISSLQLDTITYNNGINLGSATQNRVYNYLIYTTPADATLPVYTANDTITGSMYVPALPTAPQALTFTVPYGGTQTVTPGASTLNHFYFYENATDNEAIAEGNSFTTDPIYGPTTYYYSGRIESNGFSANVIAGTGNNTSQTSNAPFTFANGHSYAKILYNKEDMGGPRGRIDSIYFHVCTAETNGIAIPMKFWLKDTTNVPNIGTGSKTINWPAETANARLVFDGELTLDEVGWVGFAVEGGYDFNGEGLLLYAEHNCGDASCVTNYGINPTPKFTNTPMANNGKKVYAKAQNTPLTGAISFGSPTGFRVNTMFKMNYTCESPKGTITINTTVPQHDVGVIAITAPVAQNNSFTNNETVTVRVKNFGSQAASGFPVSYQLANNTAVTQNYSGSLAAGAEANMTFTTGCDLTSVYYSTPFRAYTGLTSDTYHGNDTTTIYVSKEDPCPSRPLALNTGAHITNVTFAALNNGTASPFINHPVAPGNGMYSDFTSTVAPVELILGQEYTLSVAHAFTAAQTKTVYKRAYIDYNRNGEFEASEAIMTSGAIPADSNNAATVQVVNVPIVGNAETGMTRMRVICSSVNVNDPCSFYNNSATAEGETEDYAVLLSAPMQVDLGIPGLLHPVGDVCADHDANLRVRVRNYGTETQTLSMANSMTVTATITGAVPGVYTTVVENGTLAPNSEMTVTIPNVNLSALGDYHVSMQVTYDGDQYLTNNTRAGDAVVSDLTVHQLPYVENFVPVGIEDIQLPVDWTVTSSNLNNYVWIEKTGASQNNGANPSGGPAHDHTSAGTSLEQYGGYATVNGVNNTTNQNKWTSLTSGCINMHYNEIYPAELNFYKYFTGAANADFEMYVETGSGEYYQHVDTLTKADGAAQWLNHLTVLHSVDEVARLRFTVTHQVYRIDPSIDDINLVTGLPDMAINRVVYPEDKSVSTACLHVNSIVVPIIELQNAGNSAVEEFDVVFNVGTGNDVVTETEHVVRHLNPGDTMIYTSTNEFIVTNLTQNWEVKATVVIPDDKRHSNDTKRTLSCTDVGIDDYETSESVYLGQNEPNPSVTVTRIPYSVPEPGKVTLDISNSAGQILYTTTEEAELGTNYIEVNTTSLAAGIYYYTIHYKDVILTKKMVVEK